MSFTAELKKFAAFNAVGAVTTIVGVLLMIVLDRAGVPYAWYTAANYGAGIVLGFWLNFRYSFKDQAAPLKVALVRYLVCFLTLWGLVQVLQWCLIDVAGWPRWAGVGFGMLLYGVVGYLASRFWIFSGKTEGDRMNTDEHRRES